MAEKRPTILQIIPELDTGGAELSTVEIAAAIVRGGGRALVLSEGGRLAHFITDAGGEFVPFPAATKNPLTMLANARVLAGSGWMGLKDREAFVTRGVKLIPMFTGFLALAALLALLAVTWWREGR